MESAPEKNSSEYISLKEAAKLTGIYSQDYLSLRARQGKLRAVKLGRNWVTKKEWLEEYLKEVREYKSNNNQTEKPTRAEETAKQTKEKKEKEFTFTTLPYQPVPSRAIAVAGALIMSILLLLSSVFYPYFESAALDNAYAFRNFVDEQVNVFTLRTKSLSQEYRIYVSKTKESIANKFARFQGNLSKNIEFAKNQAEAKAKQTAQFISKEASKGLLNAFLAGNSLGSSINKTTVSVIGRLKSGFKVLSKEAHFLSEAFVEKISGIGNSLAFFFGEKLPAKFLSLFKKPESPTKKLLPKPVRKGLVVVPSTENDELLKEKIKSSFSDEVKVFPKDESSGIIVPVFREREGGRYLYILVPVNDYQN
jgi:excisionase family DNA binding protein